MFFESIYFYIILAFILSVLLIPIIIKFCKFYSLYDSVNARKIHSGLIPRLGGVAIVLSFIISVSLCFIVNQNLSFKNAMPLLISGALIFIFGILDDLLELKAFFKLIIQIIATLIVVLNEYRFTQIFGLKLPYVVSVIFTFVWILGIINAYNLIDGLDGLCGGLSFLGLITMGIVFSGNNSDSSIISFILAASVLGFLIFNWPAPNAKIFMGDGGSQFLGFMIATIPLYPQNIAIEYNKFLIMLVVVSFPMLDTIAAVWRRLRDHRPIMSPDRLHLHHKLLNLGYTKKGALFLVLIIQIAICVLVLISTRLSKKASISVLCFAYMFVTGFFIMIHYTNRAVLNKIKLETELRHKIESGSAKAEDLIK